MQAFVLDRAGHYEFLCKLVPGARHLTIGASHRRARRQPVGRRGPGEPADREDRLPRRAARAAWSAITAPARTPTAWTRWSATCSRSRSAPSTPAPPASSSSPRERLLCEELRRRAEQEATAGAEEVASVLRTLAERIASFVDEGSYAYLLDRETTVPADAPLVAFDTRKVPRELSAAVLFVLAEHVTARIERRGAERLRETERRRVRGPLDARHRRGVEARRAPRDRRVGQRDRAPLAAPRAVPDRDQPAALGLRRTVRHGRCCATPPSSSSCASPPTSSPTSRKPCGCPTPRSQRSRG